MATAPLNKLWEAYFEDGHYIYQPADDRYSKHDDTAEWNPSAFRDVLEYDSPVKGFALGRWTVDLQTGLFYDNEASPFSLEATPLTNRKLIYFRETQQDFNMDGEGGEPYVVRYAIGYEGKNDKGKIEKKVIYING